MWLKIPVDMVWRREELCRRVEPSPWARSSEPMSSVSSCSSSVERKDLDFPKVLLGHYTPCFGELNEMK